MPLQHAHVIDLIAHDPATNFVVLGMTEPRPWDGSDRRVFELQEKVNAYLSFALDGEMEQNFPQCAGKTLRLQLDCVEPPDGKTAHFIALIREQIGFQGIEFSVNVTPGLAEAAAAAAAAGAAEEGCGSGGCGCGGGGRAEPSPRVEEECCGGGDAGGCGCAHG